MKKIIENKLKKTNSKKAYDNFDFLHSSDGRIIRMIAEYLYPEKDLRRKGVKGTIVFYGSARTLSREKYNNKLHQLKIDFEKADENKKSIIQKEIDSLVQNEDMTRYFEDGVTLSKMLSKWLSENSFTKGYHIASGGGSGMMEAANRGASLSKSRSIGFNISLPFEQDPNHYISSDLKFEFHYFFMRKFWFVYLAKAIVTLPGGFGTLDELMEILTLKQTLKVTKPLPIVLYGSQYWKNAVNFDYLVSKKLISEKDLSLFKICDSPLEAFNFITKELEKNYKKRGPLLSI